MERINRQTTKGGKINSAYRYTYDEVGNITETVNQYGWRKPSLVTETYGYDGLHRLTDFALFPLKNNGGSLQTYYSYDPAGNRLSWETSDDLQTNTPDDGFFRTYEYNEADQMLGMNHDANKKNKDYAYKYSFDENGNRINRQLADAHGPQYGVDYSYDPENRLVQAQDYQIVGQGKKGGQRIDRAFTTLEYDGGGRKLVQHYDPKQGGNGVDKRDEYVFDGLDPVAEYDMLNGQRSDYYRGAGGHIALMHQFKGGTRGQMYWYHYNNKGDVVGLTKQNGNSHHNYRYDPYGAVLPENGNFTDPHNHYTLTGKEFDENTGLVWFGARYYEPETGVWMGQDSYRGRLDSPMSLHRYGYVGNNPVSYWDWYGFWDVEGVKKEFEWRYRHDEKIMDKYNKIMANSYTLEKDDLWFWEGYSVNHNDRIITLDEESAFGGEISNSDAAEYLYNALDDDFSEYLEFYNTPAEAGIVFIVLFPTEEDGEMDHPYDDMEYHIYTKTDTFKGVETMRYPFNHCASLTISHRNDKSISIEVNSDAKIEKIYQGAAIGRNYCANCEGKFRDVPLD